jgi:hypothetical protein
VDHGEVWSIRRTQNTLSLSEFEHRVFQPAAYLLSWLGHAGCRSNIITAQLSNGYLISARRDLRQLSASCPVGVLSGFLPHEGRWPRLESEHSSQPVPRLRVCGKLMLTTRLSVSLNAASAFRGHAISRSWPHGSATSGGSRPSSVQYRIRGSCLGEVGTIVPLSIVPCDMLISTSDYHNRRQYYYMTEDTNWPPSWEEGLRQTPEEKVGIMAPHKNYSCNHAHF